MSKASEFRTYDRRESIVFLKTKEDFGGLSNMAGGFPLHVNGSRILTSEALYQACRFPHMPDVQRLILGAASPMSAKMKSKPYRQDSRPDWDHVRVKIMRWCLRVKLAQNFLTFSKLLLATGDRPIVEQSRKDEFWGAKVVDDNTLVGMNVLGRLLMELRESVKTDDQDSLFRVEPIVIPDFMLVGRPIEVVAASSFEPKPVTQLHPSDVVVISAEPVQPSFFDQPSVREAPPSYAAGDEKKAAVFDLRRYSETKGSGLPWLGSVPMHWKLRRMKTLLRERVQKGFPSEPLLAATQTKGVVRKDQFENRTVLALKDLHLLKLVRVGDFVISLRSFQGGIEYAREQGIISPAYTVLYPVKEATHGYLSWLFKSKPFVSNLALFVTGIRQGQNIDYEKLSRAVMPLPSDEEQTAIARFLDHADRRIRRAILAKQKLIKLLEEQKQAIIQRAVTRGLDPDVRLKPSGVEWLGDVPEHWEVVRFKQRVGFQEGPGIMAVDFRDEGVPLLRISCLREEIATLRGCNFLDPEKVKRRWSHFSVRAGDYLLSASASTGTVVLASEEVAGAISYTGILRLWSSSDKTFMPFIRLYMTCRPFQAQIEAAKSGVAISHFGPTHLKRMFICMPSIEKQQQIVGHLSDATKSFSGAIDRARREIALLREYRTRLIADVVTGKLDVREAAARLPDEIEPIDAALDDDLSAQGDDAAMEASADTDAEDVAA